HTDTHTHTHTHSLKHTHTHTHTHKYRGNTQICVFWGVVWVFSQGACDLRTSPDRWGCCVPCLRMNIHTNPDRTHTIIHMGAPTWLQASVNYSQGILSTAPEGMQT